MPLLQLMRATSSGGTETQPPNPTSSITRITDICYIDTGQFISPVPLSRLIHLLV